MTHGYDDVQTRMNWQDEHANIAAGYAACKTDKERLAITKRLRDLREAQGFTMVPGEIDMSPNNQKTRAHRKKGKGKTLTVKAVKK